MAERTIDMRSRCSWYRITCRFFNLIGIGISKKAEKRRSIGITGISVASLPLIVCKKRQVTELP